MKVPAIIASSVICLVVGLGIGGLSMIYIGPIKLPSWLGGPAEPGDADIQPVDSSQAKVKIMTIHASKGLEFPIVFLAGGFTQGRGGGSHGVYRDDQGRVVFDLNPDSAAQERVNAERLSEQRRLLYVAFTRAMRGLMVMVPAGCCHEALAQLDPSQWHVEETAE